MAEASGGSDPLDSAFLSGESTDGHSSNYFGDYGNSLGSNQNMMSGGSSSGSYYTETRSDSAILPQNFAVWPEAFTQFDTDWLRIPSWDELFGDRGRIERQLRNPLATNIISTRVHNSRRRKVYAFLFRLAAFYAYCYCITLLWPYVGLRCAPLPSPYDEIKGSSMPTGESPGESDTLPYMPLGAYLIKDWESPMGDWIYLICGASLLWMISQGLFG